MDRPSVSDRHPPVEVKGPFHPHTEQTGNAHDNDSPIEIRPAWCPVAASATLAPSGVVHADRDRTTSSRSPRSADQCRKSSTLGCQASARRERGEMSGNTGEGASTGRTTATGWEDAAKTATVDVVIPVFNEERSLPGCIRVLDEFLTDHFPFRCTITVVDNASTDGTPDVARSLIVRGPKRELISRCYNLLIRLMQPTDSSFTCPSNGPTTSVRAALNPLRIGEPRAVCWPLLPVHLRGTAHPARV
jgi:hypothetical protein